MLYKPYGLAAVCEKSVIVVTHENRDAAQMSPLQCEKIVDHEKSTNVREPRDDSGWAGDISHFQSPVSGTQLLPVQCEAILDYG